MILHNTHGPGINTNSDAPAEAYSKAVSNTPENQSDEIRSNGYTSPKSEHIFRRRLGMSTPLSPYPSSECDFTSLCVIMEDVTTASQEAAKGHQELP